MTMQFSKKPLFILIAINIAASILHYGHNVIHFAHYPEPTWLNAKLVDMFWFFMTPFAIASAWFYVKNWCGLGLIFTILYVLMSLLVLGHYNYAPFFEIQFIIHLFIWLETIAAIILLIYALGITCQKWFVSANKPSI